MTDPVTNPKTENMTSAGPEHRVFDRAGLRRHRNRAAGNFADYDFLLTRTMEEVSERLLHTNRNFPLALDLGSHDGALSRAVLPPEKIGRIVSADLSLAMVKGAPGPRLVADEEFLPFAGETFDLATSVLSLHWVNDLPGALIQLRRALKPDGLFIGAFFGGETLTELRQSLADAEIEIEGGLSPRVSPFADLRDVGGLLQRAGFALPVVDSDRVTVRYGNALKLMADLRGMGETNALAERRRQPMKRRTLFRAAEIYAGKFGLPDGRIPATFEIVTATGWAPHESQQQPLRPGSATHSLADALGTEERTAGEKAARANPFGKK